MATETKQPLIGLSLSQCVRDVLEGKKPEEEILVIFACTYARSSENLDEVIRRYKGHCWRQNPEEGEQIAQRLFSAGKVIQPLVVFEENQFPGHNTVGDAWVNPADFDKWLANQQRTQPTYFTDQVKSFYKYEVLGRLSQ